MAAWWQRRQRLTGRTMNGIDFGMTELARRQRPAYTLADAESGCGRFSRGKSAGSLLRRPQDGRRTTGSAR